MNDSAIRQGNNPYFVAIAAVIVGGVLGFFGSTYNTNYAAQLATQASVQTAQSSELREARDSIISIKGSIAHDESELNGTKLDVRAIEGNMNALVSQIGNLKLSVDGQTEAFHGLQKQVGDMDRWLRPDPNLPIMHGR